jgi:ribosome-associated toxin RatA of RatAB toxin-antitoxin module
MSKRSIIMKTQNKITVIGSFEEVYGLVEAVGSWPEIVEDVGDVKVLGMEARKKIVEVSTRGGVLPFKMTSVQESLPAERRLLFSHIKGVMKGVEVEWTFDEARLKKKGLVLVNVTHDFKNISPARAYILNRFFIQKRTETMLLRLKEVVEAGFLARVLLEDTDWVSGTMFENELVTVTVY